MLPPLPGLFCQFGKMTGLLLDDKEGGLPPARRSSVSHSVEQHRMRRRVWQAIAVLRPDMLPRPQVEGLSWLLFFCIS